MKTRPRGPGWPGGPERPGQAHGRRPHESVRGRGSRATIDVKPFI